MNKTLKKILSVVLALVMLMSFAAVAFATDGGVETEEHRYLFQIFWEGILSFWETIRYIFYDVFLGVAP